MESRIAFVTGSSSGIGRVLTRQLLDGGWHVVGIARRAPDITHDRYEHVVLDLTDTEALAGEADREIGARISGAPWERVALVNNAADVARTGPLERLGVDELLKIHTLNVVSPTWLMAYFVRSTTPSAALRIVNVSSGAAVQPIPGLAAYCSSKAALRMAGQVLAAELDSPLRNTPSPVDTAILSYEPGLVQTPMQQGVRNASPADFPWVGIFVDFEARGIVVPPEQPAAEIRAFLDGGRDATFTERRLGA